MVRAKPTLAAMGAVIIIMALSLWSSGGCSPTQKAARGTTARWEAELGWQPSPSNYSGKLNRRVADAGPRCLKDRLTSDFLHREVARMEAQKGGKPINGHWGDISLTQFPNPQGEFLSKFGERFVYKNGLDFSSCSGLPCIFNKIYGSSSGDEGWKIYAFYLRTGYAISTGTWLRNLGVKGAEVSVKFLSSPSVSSYLFTDGNLSSFWKLSWLLPESYRFLPTINTLHRVPNVPESELPPGFNKNVCANSYGDQFTGQIQFLTCLNEEFARFKGEEGTTDNGIHGEVYTTVTHEMTHAWDRLQAKKSVLEDRLSLLDEWKGLSGWSTAPYIDRNGVKSLIWQVDANKEGFVTEYAKTLPGEDLAETAAWLRFRPELARKRTPRKISYLSDKLFGGRTYDAEGLSKYYVSNTVERISPQILELVNGCITNPPKAGRTSSGPRLVLDKPLPDAVLGCLEWGLNQSIDSSFQELRAVEWEACGYLDDNDLDVRAQIFTAVTPAISSLVSENMDRAPIIRASSDLRSALVAQTDAREGYIHCSHQAMPEVCFKQALSDAFDHVAQPFAATLGEVLDQEKQSFIAQNPYDQTANRVSQFYHQVFAGVDPLIKASAEARWQGCIAFAPSALGESGTPLVQPFSGGTHFVASSILNCINAAALEDLKKARDEFTLHLGLSISDPDAQTLVQEVLLPIYLEALRVKEDAAVAAEELERGQRKVNVTEVISRELLANLGWLEGAKNRETAQSLCDSAAQVIFDSYFARVNPSELLPNKFAAVADLRASWSHDTCVTVIQNDKVTQKISQRSTQAWNQAMASLEQFLNVRARDTATDCIARNPGSSRVAAVKTRRRQCLTNAWSMVEKQALASWEQSTSEGQLFLSRHSDSVDYLVGRRRVLQYAATVSMESR